LEGEVPKKRPVDVGSSRLMRTGLDFIRTLFGVVRIPGVARYHPWTRPDKTDMRWLPINADIKMPDNTPMPLALLDRLIEEASHRVIFDTCGCRKAYECKDYPVEIGCLLLGDSSLDALGSSSREASVEEARELVRRAVDAGVVPYVGKARVDNLLFGVKERHRLLTVCFCCECCCITRFLTALPTKYLDPAFPRLEGVSIKVTDRCRGCGKCAEHCYLGVITIEDERAVIGERCRACGRCSLVCPNDAIDIRIEDPDFLENTYERIRAHVKHD
jgi:UDP-glucose 4-epimerase